MAGLVKKTGRPSSFTQETANAICESIAQGESLRKLCAVKGMPTMATICKWLSETPSFSEQYARARERQAEHEAERLLEIADDLDIPSDHKRIMVDVRKWIACKLLPKKYGDRQTIEHEFSSLSYAELITRAAGSLSGTLQAGNPALPSRVQEDGGEV